MNSQDSLFEELQRKRLDILRFILQSTGADQDKDIRRDDIDNAMNLSESEVNAALQHLLGRGWIACDSLLGLQNFHSPIWITHEGILELEAIIKINKSNSQSSETLIESLSSYPTPDFTNSVNDRELAKILSLRWEEANQCFQSKAYLSTIIMLGSILEGLLLDKAKQNQPTAYQAKNVPKDKNKNYLPIEDWKFVKLIEVAHECGWLDKDVKDFSDTLRDYRNLVHPNVQNKQKTYPDFNTCKIAWEVLIASLVDLGILPTTKNS